MKLVRKPVIMLHCYKQINFINYNSVDINKHFRSFLSNFNKRDNDACWFSLWFILIRGRGGGGKDWFYFTWKIPTASHPFQSWKKLHIFYCFQNIVPIVCLTEYYMTMTLQATNQRVIYSVPLTWGNWNQLITRCTFSHFSECKGSSKLTLDCAKLKCPIDSFINNDNITNYYPTILQYFKVKIPNHFHIVWKNYS